MRRFIKQPLVLQLLVLLLSILGFYNLPAPALQDYCRPQIVTEQAEIETNNIASENCVDAKKQVITPATALMNLAQADIVYLGETHDSPKDHQIQLEIIQKLWRYRKIAIAMEMFQRPYQAVLDRYITGKLSEQELLQQSEYKQRWGFPWEHYAPIVRFAKEKQLPILALNTPTEVTRQVARQGLDSLTPQQQQFIPPFSQLRTDNAEYRQMMLNIFQQHQQASHGSSADFERFFLSQVLWDETMAETITLFVKTHPDYQVVVLAGQGHIIYGYGIPDRVARRLKNKPLQQRSVLLSPPEAANDTNKPIADLIWQQQSNN